MLVPTDQETTPLVPSALMARHTSSGTGAFGLPSWVVVPEALSLTIHRFHACSP